MKKITLVLLGLVAILPLMGCVPVAFMAGAAATSAVVNDSRSVDTIVSDRTIVYKAEAKISKDPVLSHYYSVISVTSLDYAVLISGVVPNQDIKDRADKVVRSVPNVKKVYNQLQIGLPETIVNESNDAWITTKVKSVMIGEKDLKSALVKVITENCVVYLMGNVTHAQGDLAATVASRVTGVDRIVKVFNYID